MQWLQLVFSNFPDSYYGRMKVVVEKHQVRDKLSHKLTNHA